MQTDAFIGTVAERLDGADEDQARRSTTAVLQTLGATMSAGEANDLAAQLPRALADELRLTADEQVDHDRDTFLTRVAELAGIDDGTSEIHTRTVLGVLREAVTGGEFVDAVLDLPDALDGLVAGRRDG